MKFILIFMSLFISSVFAKDPRVVSTYTDFYNDSDLIAECLIFSDGTGMKLFNNIVPYYKPEMFNLKSKDFKMLNASLKIEALGAIDSKTKECNESVGPYEVLGQFSDLGGPYITAEARNNFNSDEPDCWIRLKADHVTLSEKTKSAKILKNVCGFRDL